MSTTEYPVTPPHLPTGEDAKTPPPGGKPNPNIRPSSPDPNCAICLGDLENMSYTDSCFHKFCFLCLKEWSKVKAECPLCKAKFKSIIHNIKSDQIYESYQIPPSPPRASVASVSFALLQEMRRFRYATTGGGNGDRFPFFTLPTLPIPHVNIARIPNSSSSGASSGRRHWHQRRGTLATTEARRDIYRRNQFVDPASLVDATGRYRESTPEWYSANPASTHRLVPWLNRELNALLDDPQNSNYYVTQVVLGLINQHDIRSPEFRRQLTPFLGSRTEHFQHEFYHFARSCYDMVGHDLHAVYRDGPNISTEIVPSDTSESDSDDILIVDEVHNEPQQVSTSSSNPTNAAELPSTSRGVASDDNQRRSTDDIEIVGVVKPRHLRTPVIVSLSSDDETESKDVAKNEDVSTGKKKVDFTIEISDSEDEIPAPNFPSPDAGNSASAANRWSTSSEDEMLGRRRDKGKGKGKGKRSKQKHSIDDTQASSTASAARRLSQATSSEHAATEVTSSTGSTTEGSSRLATSESQRVHSSLDMRSSSSSAVIEAEERLLEAWRSKMAARSRTSSTSSSSSHEASREKYKRKKEKKSKKSSKEKERTKKKEERSRHRVFKYEHDTDELNRSNSRSDRKRKRSDAGGSNKMESCKRSRASNSDSEDRPLSELRRQKPASHDDRNLENLRVVASNKRRVSLTSSQLNRKSSVTSQECDYASVRTQHDAAMTSSESDSETKLKSVVVRIKKP